jgi:hypothetical protein
LRLVNGTPSETGLAVCQKHEKKSDMTGDDQYATLICAPRVCATPSTIPPTSVPTASHAADDDRLEAENEHQRP